MDFIKYLSKWENYHSLVVVGKYTARYASGINSEDLNDIISEALEKLLDYFSRNPEKLIEIEKKDPVEINNYLKKAMKNHVINLLKKRNRKKKQNIECMVNLVKTSIQSLDWRKGDELNPVEEKYLNERRGSHFLTGRADCSHFSPDKLRKDIHYFIEEKYGREGWNQKKNIIDIFFERFEKSLTLKMMKVLYPDENIPSLNTEANRILKKYLLWIKKVENRLDFPGSL